ncbi:bifunctional diaminohydroxyphosphoribosylaminopyrimidine deaminase/5-amino-6-(5-phosphoribosylamino)uracil reductase RibD [Histidinibacterium lentulum]|uniref:Riboflavin biosynthesis protein RibD n=2 Tax=Histidinibacterium lentulum TaxID=2480588 RepID=A0A3N2R8R3_9RHOB|nr:bifunctional diaminohydroxyphosphoribosylaminopyrimidine deaminase/5-amino-6-(5-phosphoribosylamino)uracil reductase RibD [Histidinibacterium lentulum]
MGAALALGRRGLGRTWPNPAVGCVLVRDGRILARARTADGGRPHAETQALTRTDARGATAYVTLEPCAHEGATPSCAAELTKAGIARAVIACRDPDPRTSGEGIARLRAANIPVTEGIRRAEAEADLAGYLLSRTRGRPRVTLKLAASLDGRIATASGESRWITAPPARRLVHALRARHDAVMVGAGTARTDDPLLTVRDIGHDRQPVRVVLSRRLDLPFPSALTATLDAAPLWLCHGPEATEEARARWSSDPRVHLLECATEGRQLSPAAVLSALGTAGLTSVFCEGGGSLAASLLEAGLVDELVCFTAGTALGAEGTPMIGALGLDSLAAAPRFTLHETRAIGPDVLHVWRRLPLFSG